MGSCHGSKTSSNEIFNPNENLECFSLIWLDDINSESHKNKSLQQQLRSIINYLKIFENQNDCEESIKQTSKDEYIIFIVNDQIGEKIIANIHHLPQIFSIYIYSLNKDTDQQWINQYPKIKSICMNSDELLIQINTDQIKCNYIKDQILFDIFHTNKSNDLNQEFLYSQILIDVLLQMDSLVNDRISLINLSRNQYKGNKSQLNIIRDFQQNYSSDNAISWFLKDTFISQLLNKALRVQNIDLLFLSRFFLHDMEQQLKEYQCLTLSKVYRYQLMSNRELQLLKNSVGQFISINNFLLTNINRDLVLPHSKLSSNHNEIHPILFEITADPTLNKIRPFASITSENNDQNEVLFMFGSIFQLNNIRQDDDDIWIIEMTLSSKTDPQLKSIFNNYKNDDNDDDINLLSFGSILQKMNKIDETEKYYHRLFNELPDDDDRIGCCCLNLGNIAFLKLNYNSSLEWLLKSLDISMRTLQPNDIFLALIYNSLGHVYNVKHDSKFAIEHYNKAILIWKQSIDDHYLNIAECTNNIGIIYKQEKNLLRALECFKKTFAILEKYLPNDHFDLSKSHCNIASVYRQLGEYDLALEHYNFSFKILEKFYSANHPNVAKALGNIGIVHALKGNRQNALEYYEKAAEIYRQALPPTHINNIKIGQLIRTISSPNRKISFGPIDSI